MNNRLPKFEESIYFLGKLSQSLFGFASIGLLSALFSVSQLSLYILLLSILLFSKYLSQAGLEFQMISSISGEKDPDKIARKVGGLLFVVTAFSLIISTGLYMFLKSEWFAWIFGFEIDNTTALSAMGIIIFGNIQMVISERFRAERRFGLAVVTSSNNHGLYICIFWVMATLLPIKAELHSVFMALFVVHALAASSLLAISREKISFSRLGSEIGRLAKSSKDVILAQQILGLSANIDIWIAGAIFKETDFLVFAIGKKIVQLLNTISQAMANLVAPGIVILSRIGQIRRRETILQRYGRINFILCGLAGILFVLFWPFISKTMVGIESKNYLFISIFFLAAMVNFYFMFTGLFLILMMKSVFVAKVGVLTLAIFAVNMAVLTHWLGLMGAPIALMIHYFLFNLILYRYIYRNYDLQMRLTQGIASIPWKGRQFESRMF